MFNSYVCRAVLCALLFCIPTHGWPAVVLQYHHIGEEFPFSTSIPLARFEAHLDYLERHDFQVVPLETLVENLRRSKSLPDKTVALTFDDAYTSVLTQAYPLLRKRRWPFTVFVTSGQVDQGVSGVMSWSQLRQLQGATLANHSVSHSHWIRRTHDETVEQWADRIREDISLAQRRIREETGQDHKLLAYPYGEYNIELLDLVDRLGYVGFGQQSGALGELSDLRLLPRFPFAGGYGDAEDFSIKVHSRALPVSSMSDDQGSRGWVDPVRREGHWQPVLNLNMPLELAQRLSCFASGQGSIPVSVSGVGAIVKVVQDVPVGRSRVNCTAPAADGRFYWFSQIFIRPMADGEWYLE